MAVNILAPHRDDAAFSCGLVLRALLLAGAEVRIITVCTRSSYAPYIFPQQQRTLSTITELRKQEDDKFLQVLFPGRKVDSAVQMVDLNWLDAPERWSMHAENTLNNHGEKIEEIHSLHKQLEGLNLADLVLAPLALGGHVDHRLVRNAACASVPATKLLLYEDLPYAARGMRDDAECTHPAWTSRCYPFQMPAGAGTKHRYALCYPSQIDDATAREIDDYSYSLGNRERFYGLEPTLNRLDEILDG